MKPRSQFATQKPFPSSISNGKTAPLSPGWIVSLFSGSGCSLRFARVRSGCWLLISAAIGA